MKFLKHTSYHPVDVIVCAQITMDVGVVPVDGVIVIAKKVDNNTNAVETLIVSFLQAA